MQTYSDSTIISIATDILQEKGRLSKREIARGKLQVESIASDGSTRRFWRCILGDRSLCVVAAPLGTSENERRESRSAWYIGEHLYSKKCEVPKLFGWHEESGMLLFEDLGDQRLHGLVRDVNGLWADNQQIRETYALVVRQLAYMQIEGAVDFNTYWCWDTGYYDKELMLSRESEYFLKSFWIDFLQRPVPLGIDEEFQFIAGLAAKTTPKYFLHRDFQSRNIMISEGSCKFIDFQGGRLGPLGYDLASLLIDPYSDLDCTLQEELEEIYFSEISRYIVLDRERFQIEYNALALQRNLQILGAFAFLTQVRKKPFFIEFIQPALLAAMSRLEHPIFKDLKVLRKMIESGLQCK